MLHIDEHTLELYALGAPDVASRRGEIASHLAECHGCREMAEEMARFHAELADELDRPVAQPGRALERRREGLPGAPFAPPVRYAPTTPMQKVRYLMIRYPAAAAAAGVAFAALFLGLGMFVSGAWSPKAGDAVTDWNPALVNYNTAADMLEVLNAEHQLLWQRKSSGLGATRLQEFDLNIARTIVADLDRDGRNEVVTTIGILGLDSLRVGGEILKVFDGRGELRWSRQFVDSVSYPGRSYAAQFSARGLTLWVDPATLDRSLLVLANHSTRSPSVVYRLDPDGRTIGSYWHFGVLNTGVLRNLDGSATPSLLLSGKNDVLDGGRDGEFAFLAALDPSRIVGETRSTLCPVLDLPASAAERYYVRFPRSDLDSAAVMVVSVGRIDHDDPERFVAFHGSAESWFFDYVFDNSVGLVEVKSEDRTDTIHKQLAREGKVSGVIDAAYLARLKAGVRYWDGSRWLAERVPIRPALP